MNQLLELERSLVARKRRAAGAGAVPRRRTPATPAPLSARRPYSRPFYATGEHTLTGEDLAAHEPAIKSIMTDLLLEVGRPDAKGQRTGFTYGELITMADLFETFDDMDRAAADELLRLRALVRRDREHYAKIVLGTGAGGAKVGQGEWQQTTTGRYLKLALDNFAHFAPTNPALTPAFKSADPRNHKRLWESYHMQALKHAQANRSAQGLKRALAINAFGDHFLTDAFAAGHLFNKGDVAARFNAQIMDAGGKLTAKGNTFIETLAKRAFYGDLRLAFSRHETVETVGPEWKGYIWFPHHHNIDEASDFEAFLKEVHKAEPKFLGDALVAVIIHDKLNSFPGGLPVHNSAGDTWNLTGDGTLNQKNLGVIRKAVARSIYDVAVDVNQVKDLNALLDYAWFYTPRPTDTSKGVVKTLIDTYTDPAHPLLMIEAVKVLQAEYKVILREAIARGKLQFDDDFWDQANYGNKGRVDKE
jgi:hypothetical protein